MIANKYKVLFLDIETAPLFYLKDVTQDVIPEPFRSAWKDRARMFDLIKEKAEWETIQQETRKQNPSYFPSEEQEAEVLLNLSYVNKCSLYPEFSQIVCISIGLLNADNKLDVKCFYNKNNNEISERIMLLEFENYCLNNYRKNFDYLCAHNGKQFDYPFIIKRMLINKIPLPSVFKVLNMKPWEITQFLDTYDIWKFGSTQSASLRAIYAVLFKKDCKDDIKGMQVAPLWFEDASGNMERISTYCNSDVGYMCNIFWYLNDLV